MIGILSTLAAGKYAPSGSLPTVGKMPKPLLTLRAAVGRFSFSVSVLTKARTSITSLKAVTVQTVGQAQGSTPMNRYARRGWVQSSCGGESNFLSNVIQACPERLGNQGRIALRKVIHFIQLRLADGLSHVFPVRKSQGTCGKRSMGNLSCHAIRRMVYGLLAILVSSRAMGL